MVGAALRGAEENGFRLVRKPGRGLSNTWELSKNGKTRVASVRKRGTGGLPFRR